MSLPTFTFEVGFAANPLDLTPVFTNLAADLETLNVSRGRQSEDDQAQTGVCQGTLIDTTRKYDPNNAAGPFYPNVQPMKPVRVLATLDAVTYPVFYGWIDIQNGWVRSEDNAAAATVLVPCNDGFEVLNNINSKVGLSWVLLGAGAVIAIVLNRPEVSWPAAWRSIDAGVELQSVPGFTTYPYGTPALKMIRDAEATEPGLFYFDGRGFACFRDRHSRPLATSLATFCDTHNLSAGRILYDSVTTRRSKVQNDVTVNANGLNPQEATDATSTAAYLIRSASYSTVHASEPAALLAAQYQVNRHKDSYETLESLTLQPGTDSPTWLQILSREINDRITVVRTPPGGGAAVTADYFIEGINIDWGPGPDASCTWRLSPAAPTNAWLAGTAGSSEAGTTTRAAY